MKKFIKDNLLGFILGAIIFSGITTYATIKIGADKITYINNDNQEQTVEEVLNNLSTTQATKVNSLNTQLETLKNQNRLLAIISGWKKGTGWNDAGLSVGHYIDNEYLTQNGGTITVKKACKLKITPVIINAGATTSAPQYKLYRGSTAIISLTNTKASNDMKTTNTTINVSAGETFYAQMYGGAGNSSYFITTFELVNS